jgi:hypothetical protein
MNCTFNFSKNRRPPTVHLRILDLMNHLTACLTVNWPLLEWWLLLRIFIRPFQIQIKRCFLPAWQPRTLAIGVLIHLLRCVQSGNATSPAERRRRGLFRQERSGVRVNKEISEDYVSQDPAVPKLTSCLLNIEVNVIVVIVDVSACHRQILGHYRHKHEEWLWEKYPR